jgi:hypothetical protein
MIWFKTQANFFGIQGIGRFPFTGGGSGKSKTRVGRIYISTGREEIGNLKIYVFIVNS